MHIRQAITCKAWEARLPTRVLGLVHSLLLGATAAAAAATGGAAVSTAAPGAMTSTPAHPVVVANHETLEGAYDERQPTVAIFRGVPFAAAPIGVLRWQAPQPHRPRSGRSSARAFAAACYQDDYNSDWYRGVAEAFGAASARFIDPPFSEDCLYLNIWTSNLERPPLVPVIVWIHGGGNFGGWSFEPDYDGANLAARGQVVVSIAYRLGVFGFFGHPELHGAAACCNFGLLDQIAALRWVRDNIRQFGGDPDNVTIAGESAGAADVGYLIASPLAKGWFRRAISESGGYQMLDATSSADADKVGLAVASTLGGSRGLAGLRRRSSAEIFTAAKTALPDHAFGPVVDGISLTESPAAAYGHGVPVDLLIGTNQDEWYMYVDGDPEKLASDLDGVPSPVREALAARAKQEPSVQHARDLVESLTTMHCSAYAMARAAAQSAHRAWVYRFTRIRPGPGGQALLAYHGAEIPYVFDTHDVWLPTDESDKRLTSAMLAYWSNFARTGDPNDLALPPWPAFQSADVKVQELGTRIGAEPAPDLALCEHIAGALYPGWAP